MADWKHRRPELICLCDERSGLFFILNTPQAIVGIMVVAEAADANTNTVRLYGNYVEGLEEDADAIYSYFGEDFITPQRKENPLPFSVK